MSKDRETVEKMLKDHPESVTEEKPKTVHDLSVMELAEFLHKSVSAAKGQGASHIVLHVEVVKRVAEELAASVCADSDDCRETCLLHR